MSRLEAIKREWKDTKILYAEDINWLINRVKELKRTLIDIKSDIEIDYTEEEINNSPLMTVMLEQIDEALEKSE